jgi:hypothetical protein
MTTAMQAMHVPRHRHSPRVRRLAREAGIDPDTVAGSGTGGRVRPSDIAIAGIQPPVIYIAELDLSVIPNAVYDRPAVVGAIAYALLDAVRRHVPIVDLEIVSGARRVFVHDAHNLSHVAITVIDHQAPTGPLLLAPSRPDRLLSAVIGRTEGRHPTALLVVSTRDTRLRDLLIEIEMD